MKLLWRIKDARSPPAKLMKVLAQTDFCAQLPDAASCTKITTTDIILIGRVQIRFQ